MNATGPPIRFPKSSRDPIVAPYQFEWTVNIIIWIIIATAIAELETGRSASPVSRDPRAFRRFSHSQPLLSEYRRNSRIRHLRLWLLEVHFRRSHIDFVTGFSA